jgi:hypothetical protein
MIFGDNYKEILYPQNQGVTLHVLEEQLLVEGLEVQEDLTYIEKLV